MTTYKPTRNPAKRPECFGRPTLLNVGCVACAARPACCIKLSDRFRSVSVSARPLVAKTSGMDVTDKVASVWGEAGVDFALWVPFGRAVADYKLKVSKGKSPYLIRLTRDKKFVLGVVRMDERTGVEIHVRGRGVFNGAATRMVSKRKVFVFECAAGSVDVRALEVAKAVALYILKIAFVEDETTC